MSDTAPPARESMEFDVVIVGAGPAGLAAAIRLKQVSPDISVVVVEKGSEVGAHILSGAVIDPSALDRLLPEWRGDAERPLKTEVTDDHFMWLTEKGSISLPAHLRAAADEQSRLLHRLARADLQISREQGRSARHRNLSGLRGGGNSLRPEWRSARRRDRRHGHRQERRAQSELHPRHGTAREIHFVRRRRARQSDQATARALQPLRRKATSRNSASA